jgi:hypothetical protein
MAASGTANLSTLVTGLVGVDLAVGKLVLLGALVGLVVFAATAVLWTLLVCV